MRHSGQKTPGFGFPLPQAIGILVRKLEVSVDFTLFRVKGCGPPQIGRLTGWEFHL